GLFSYFKYKKWLTIAYITCQIMNVILISIFYAILIIEKQNLLFNLLLSAIVISLIFSTVKSVFKKKVPG
ncbi:hypothetical protein J7L48_06460, partial [bacterium]|nr:hypothetical protein [bacterium]